MPKSRQKSNRQILGVISVTRAEQMLTELVNTDLSTFTKDAKDANAWERLFRRFPEIAAVPVETIPHSEVNFERFKLVAGVANYLRKAWDAPDLRRFDWYTWAAQREYEYEAAS